MITTVLTIVFVIVIPGVVLYNRLIRSRNRVDTAWSDIDVQLQRRHDLIPRLVTAVDQYAKYERATLEAITELRAEAMRETDVDARGEAEEKLTEGVARLIALAENYPDLKASQNFIQLQRSLNEVEEQISAARRAYNAAVTDYNNAVEMLPTSIIAAIIGYKMKKVFEISEEQRQDIDTEKLFSS